MANHRKIRALLINPDVNLKSYLPLGLVSLLGYVQKLGCSVEIYSLHNKTEQQFISKLQECNWDLVGFTGLISDYFELKTRTKQARDHSPTSLLIVGGPLANVIPEYLINKLEVDLVIRGEGEVPFAQILNSLSLGNFTPADVPGAVYKDSRGSIMINKAAPVLPMDELPLLPDRGFDFEPYISHPLGRTVNIQLSRGCPNSCSYCDNSLFPKTVRRRSRANIQSELVRIFDQIKFDHIYLDDLNPFIPRDLIKDFCEIIASLGLPIQWYGNGYVSVMDSFDLKLLKEGRCKGLHFGIESGSKEILSGYNKNTNLDQALRVIHAVQKAGIEVKLHWMIGAPNETIETIRESIEYFVRLGVIPAVKFLTPLPGTPMFNIAVEKKRIVDLEHYLVNFRNWYDDRPVCNLSNFSDDELIQIAHEAEAEIKARTGLSKAHWSGIWRDSSGKTIPT